MFEACSLYKQEHVHRLWNSKAVSNTSFCLEEKDSANSLLLPLKLVCLNKNTSLRLDV
jgi:hypothetical protein